MTENDVQADEALMHSDFDCQKMNPSQLSTAFGANIHSLSGDMNANLGCEEQVQYSTVNGACAACPCVVSCVCVGVWYTRFIDANGTSLAF